MPIAKSVMKSSCIFTADWLVVFQLWWRLFRLSALCHFNRRLAPCASNCDAASDIKVLDASRVNELAVDFVAVVPCSPHERVVGANVELAKEVFKVFRHFAIPHQSCHLGRQDAFHAHLFREEGGQEKLEQKEFDKRSVLEDLKPK